MKKASLYLLIIVTAGSTFVAFWTYQKYFKKEEQTFLSFTVERGDLQEIVRARGQVVAENDFNLEFTYPSMIERVFVTEGQVVRGGTPLLKTDTREFELEVKRLQAEIRLSQASLASAKAQAAQFRAARDAQTAKLSEIQKGVRPEELQIREADVNLAAQQLASSRQALQESLQQACATADSLIRNTTDQLFLNAGSSDPDLIFTTTDSSVEQKADLGRVSIEGALTDCKNVIEDLADPEDPSTALTDVTSILTEVRIFLDTLTLALASSVPTVDIPQSSLDAWKTALSRARGEIDRVSLSLILAEEKWRVAAANLSIMQKTLDLARAGSLEEQVAAQAALVRQAEANIAAQDALVEQFEAAVAVAKAAVEAVQEKIRKSTLYAPVEVRVAKIWIKSQEVARPGVTAISLETTGHKIQADISELDIGKILTTTHTSVLVTFDAFPERTYMGNFLSVDPRQILKEGDTYYRMNIGIEKHGDEIRTGMSADVLIQTRKKEAVLILPELVVSKKDGKSVVTVLQDGIWREEEIQTGISDGEKIEIISGLQEGAVVVVSAD
jgi:HlyD family secretion protein